MKLVNHLMVMLSGVSLMACTVKNQEKPSLEKPEFAQNLENLTEQHSEKASDFYPVPYQTLQGWDKEDYVQLLTLFKQNCQYLRTLPSSTALGGVSGLIGNKVQDWYPVCDAVNSVSNDQPAYIKQFFEKWLQPYQYSTTVQAGKITGYYEPEIEGSLVKTPIYHVPVYMRPSDLVARKADNQKIEYGRMVNNLFVPYYTRAEINDGALEGKKLEVMWLKNPEDLFLMQIQGAGRILLPDGQVKRLAYAGKNGQPYTPIGKILIEKGEMDAASVNIYTIRAWLMTHPDQAKELMEQNKNYVFFKLLADQLNNQGPKGAFGIPLTAGRSVAVDKQDIPLGIPLWLDTTMPVDSQQTRHAWQRMVFSHDIGGDIHGVNRVDLFTGWGKDAEWYAGLMHERGKVFLFLPCISTHLSTNSIK